MLIITLFIEEIPLHDKAIQYSKEKKIRFILVKSNIDR
jgi:hypothetical protein